MDFIKFCDNTTITFLLLYMASRIFSDIAIPAMNLGEHVYRNGLKFSDSVDPDQEQSDQGLHCLPFSLHLSDALFYGKSHLVQISG